MTTEADSMGDTREEYFNHNLDKALWWTSKDYEAFKHAALTEIADLMESNSIDAKTAINYSHLIEMQSNCKHANNPVDITAANEHQQVLPVLNEKKVKDNRKQNALAEKVGLKPMNSGRYPLTYCVL